jgi:hypothetical protein
MAHRVFPGTCKWNKTVQKEFRITILVDPTDLGIENTVVSWAERQLVNDFSVSRTNWYDCTHRKSQGCLHFIFPDQNDALMFSLRWCYLNQVDSSF